MSQKLILESYKQKIADILKVKPEDIKIFKDGMELGVVKYSKSVEKIKEYCKERNIPVVLEDWIVPMNFKLGEYSILYKEESISTFKLYGMPHCCAYMVSCNVYIQNKFRSKGLGTLLNLFRIDIGKQLGYSAILCTDIEQNTCQRKILKKNGWKDVHEIRNKRTGNRVFLTVIDI